MFQRHSSRLDQSAEIGDFKKMLGRFALENIAVPGAVGSGATFSSSDENRFAADSVVYSLQRHWQFFHRQRHGGQIAFPIYNPANMESENDNRRGICCSVTVLLDFGARVHTLQYSDRRPGVGQNVQPGSGLTAIPEVSGFNEDVDFPGSFGGNVALLMEEDPMAISNFASVLLHFRSMLGSSWEVVILTRRGWKIPESLILRQLLSDGKIKVRFLPDEVSFPSHPSVSIFLTDPWLWETFEKVNRVLMFQADSIICSNSKASVDDFLEWDFIGAPVLPAYVDSTRPNPRSFNGGLSIRNPRIFAEIARDPNLNFTQDLHSGPYDKLPNNMRFEDHWFMWRIDERPDLNAQIPSPEVAGQFSVETWYFDHPLGYHQPHRWQAERYSEIVEWCPEVGLIYNQEAPDQRWN
ncbi:hypothetical protein J7T55_004497 [Diaporthe amygdali]|uniref:uncharacterized protein n=1 Tax=Phomopsis amygdali TaxID=1214568 RepID=UPI0022FF284B|nr:uncharacterized protein J7T55_004497 [Diaporthe amygdali]KAJ0114756.1 hypothetical protein J7T55_004497 [Diaporthe amygdali]